MNSHTFDIQPLHRFAGSNAAIRRPKEIAYFSYDDEHKFRLDESSLRYYYPPKLPADLNRGFETFEKLDDSKDEHLDALLDRIIALEQNTGAKCEADVITWRGMMTKYEWVTTNDFFGQLISCMPRRSGLEANNLIFFKGSIFIEENNTYKNAQKQKQLQQMSPAGAPSQTRMMYWGYKFETLSLLDQPWAATPRETIESREAKVVNNSSQYCSVVRTGIGGTKLVIGGEVDAVWDCKPEQKEDPINWVELKTTAEIRNDKDMWKYERKLLKFWAQSFLLGVPKIVVGFRNGDGILQRIEELSTHEIPGFVKRNGKGTWDGNICINFTSELLHFSGLTGEGLRNVITTEVFKLEESGHGGILSDGFIEWRSRT
ncbi:conserved hypothetical protein [Uncinocarpus reesii 1704]|uniref:Decapping nuclease n=1 Tax=Uncinocarpus reesii (strain UAMH 1704) TaxID=336963 RepID=C4JP74_UNCRE|nr:uncharacterized protein UREG_03133 [Uncinocarpus reesii 1704]EEP78288.1 conserved hypothetical protein [Uncinocarpus reesii 1704]